MEIALGCYANAACSAASEVADGLLAWAAHPGALPVDVSVYVELLRGLRALLDSGDSRTCASQLISDTVETWFDLLQATRDADVASGCLDVLHCACVRSAAMLATLIARVPMFTCILQEYAASPAVTDAVLRLLETLVSSSASDGIPAADLQRLAHTAAAALADSESNDILVSLCCVLRALHINEGVAQSSAVRALRGASLERLTTVALVVVAEDLNTEDQREEGEAVWELLLACVEGSGAETVAVKARSLPDETRAALGSELWGAFARRVLSRCQESQ